MTAIERELDALKAEFDSLPDGFARYSYLTELSALLHPPADLRREDRRYAGCQSQVWLGVGQEHGLCRLDGDSDTLLIRGVLALFREVLDGQPVNEVLAADFDLLSELGLAEHFDARRTAGTAGLLPEIQRRLRDEL